MALELTHERELTAADRARVDDLAAMDDASFIVAVTDHLRSLTADSRRPLWTPALAPRTLDALARLSDPGVGGDDVAILARAEHNLLSIALKKS